MRKAAVVVLTTLSLLAFLSSTWEAGPARARSGEVPSFTGEDTPLLISHRARISLDPTTHTISVVDTVRVPAQLDTFTLNFRLQLVNLEEVYEAADGQTRSAIIIYSSDQDMSAQADFTHYVPAAPPPDAEPFPACRQWRITYHGEFFESVQNVTFGRENVGGEIQATISDEGIYLSASARWLPTFGDQVMVTHHLIVDTPAGIEPVTQGVRTLQETADGSLITVWDAPFPSDGLNLVAGRYSVTEESYGDVTIATYLLDDDPKLSALYLERTRAYLAMYEEMLGPYPYGKFATVENWFPTGYGMPSYTLLGGVVLRLPFIPYTSFGHEICHNWWGNSVFVDTEQGNWCEGLTVYCADYHYKEQESPEAAREYRRNLLKDYAAYVRDGNDFPLTEFVSRHSGATRAVGYGKSMMVIHMIDRMIGRETFLAALRDVYAEKRFQQTCWSDFFTAFTRESGRDLTIQQEQWLTRVGAPELALDGARRKGDRIHLELSQDEPIYDLEIPIAVTTDAGRVERIVRLDKVRDEFDLTVPGATALAVDPDYHLFRRLAPVEIEPTISQVLGEESLQFVLPAAGEAELAAARQFAAAFAEDEDPALHADGQAPRGDTPDAGHSAVILNPDATILKEWSPPELTVSGQYVFLEGKRYSLQEYNLVFAADNPDLSTVTDMLVVCRDAAQLPSLARRLGHYGKYSWLLLPVGSGRPLRGNWSPAESPLAVTFTD